MSFVLICMWYMSLAHIVEITSVAVIEKMLQIGAKVNVLTKVYLSFQPNFNQIVDVEMTSSSPWDV